MDSGTTLFDVCLCSEALHLINLTITGGATPGGGAGVFTVFGGPTTLLNTKVSGNEAVSSSNSAGGGILAIGNVSLTNSTVSNNRATTDGEGSGSTVRASGGGVQAFGNLTVTKSVISGNQA